MQLENLRGVRAFVEVARSGSFVKAAERLNCSTTTASRLVRELEQQLGHALLLRTTRNVTLNSFGHRRLADCERILASVDALDRGADSEKRALTGELRIASTSTFARTRLMPLVPEFLERHPHLNMHWHLSDERLDLSAQGLDMAVRVAHLGDSGMVARRLGRVDIWLVAAPSLLAREGMPRVPHDVSKMTCTVCTVPHFRNRWPLDPDAHVNGPVWTDCGDASREAAIAGLGVAFLPDFLVAEAVADKRLIRLFPERRFSSVEVAVLYPGRHQISAAAAAFGDYLIAQLAERIPSQPTPV